MHSTPYILALAPLALALPQNEPAQNNPAPWNTVTGFNAVLDPAIQKDWYRDFNATATNATASNPATSDQCRDPRYDSASKTWQPKIDDWISWSKMWELNEPHIKKSSEKVLPDTNVLKKAIEAQSFKSKVDARLILAFFLNEADGNVGTICSPGNNVDCGMMQVRGGRSFEKAGSTPEESIKNMILDGLYGNRVSVAGSTGTPGFLDIINGQEEINWSPQIGHKSTWAGNPFGAARFYNSGDAPDTDLTVLPPSGSGVHDYVCKFASRLVGWQSPWQTQ